VSTLLLKKGKNPPFGEKARKDRVPNFKGREKDARGVGGRNWGGKEKKREVVGESEC